jgi:hypothetical protein
VFGAEDRQQRVNLNIVLPALSSLLCFVFAATVADQWIRRRHAYQLVWAAGLLWFGLAAGSEALAGMNGWNEGLYRAWYLFGAVWVAGWLGLGTVYLLARTRFGYAVAASLLVAGLFTFLTDRRYHYPESGSAALIYFGLAVLAAAVILVLSARRDARWAHVAGALVVGGSAASVVMMVGATLAPPGYALDPATGIPVGDLFPGYLRLLTPLFNITGAFALVFGALYSAYMFMPKQRVIRYSLSGPVLRPAWFGNLLLAPIAVTVNFFASLPGALAALFRGELSSRVPATILIALGGLVPSITSGMNRFGITWAFFGGEFIGVLLIFIGFLVSIEVFSDIRLPFTHIVLVRRSTPPPAEFVDSAPDPA